MYDHQIDVRVVSREGTPVQHRVSIFDHSMGYSREWAERAIGVSTPAQPYSGKVSSTATVTLLNHPLPPRLDIAFELPEVSADGYYLMSVDLPAESGRDGKAAFVHFDEYFPEANAPTLSVKYVSSPLNKGWRVRLDVQIDRTR